MRSLGFGGAMILATAAPAQQRAPERPPELPTAESSDDIVVSAL
jgi:hypothetical protein